MEILSINKNNYGKTVSLAARALKEGKVIVCPTDTVYGLICDADNKKAVANLFKIKNRPKSKPVALFVKDIKMAKRLARIDRPREEFLRKAWPGAVTVILESSKKFSPLISRKNTLGMRIPKYSLVTDLIRKLNRTLAQTSANISGEPASGNIKKVLQQFFGKKYQPDLVLDAGNLPKRKPSKVVDLTVYPYKILRI